MTRSTALHCTLSKLGTLAILQSAPSSAQPTLQSYQAESKTPANNTLFRLKPTNISPNKNGRDSAHDSGHYAHCSGPHALLPRLPTLLLRALRHRTLLRRRVSGATRNCPAGRSLYYWVVFFIGGLLYSGLAVFLIQSGVFLVGFCGGAELSTLAIGILITSTFDSESSSSGVQLLCISAAGLLDGFLTTKVKKPALLMALSFTGASLLTTSVRYFVDKKPVENVLKANSDDVYSSYLDPTDEITMLEDNLRASWWTLCAVSMTLFAVGALAQFKSSREIDHEVLVDKLQFKRKSEEGDESESASTEVHFENIFTPQGEKVATNGDPRSPRLK